VHNYFVIEDNYSHSVIYNFKLELKFWKNYSVVTIIILLILISRIIIYYCYYLKILWLIIYDKYLMAFQKMKYETPLLQQKGLPPIMVRGTHPGGNLNGYNLMK